MVALDGTSLEVEIVESAESVDGRMKVITVLTGLEHVQESGESVVGVDGAYDWE